MVSWDELLSRWKDFLKFNKQEISGIAFAILVTGFVFSFRDWGGEQFSFATGMTNLLLMVLVAGISFFFRTACQKMYALSQGYDTQFKVWWLGLLIMLLVSFFSFGLVPLVLVGTVITSVRVKQRLGEFRYGFNYGENAAVGAWGVAGNLILGMVFAIGLYFSPESYFFYKGMLLNIIMAFFALIPIPQLDGMKIFFGAKKLYFLSVGLVILAAILLLTQTTFGLIASIVIGAILGIAYIAVMSEV